MSNFLLFYNCAVHTVFFFSIMGMFPHNFRAFYLFLGHSYHRPNFRAASGGQIPLQYFF